jgi:hypothetical protein
MIISAQIISLHRTWFVHHPHHLTPYPPSHTDLIVYRYTIRPCAQIAFTLGENATMAVYPQCVDYFNGQIPNLPVIVTADFASENSCYTGYTLWSSRMVGFVNTYIRHRMLRESHTPSVNSSFHIKLVIRHKRGIELIYLTAEPHTQRIQPLTSSLLRTPTRTRDVETRLRRPDRRKIRRR